MHAQLLTLGFTKVGPGRYFSAELGVTVMTRPDGNLDVLVGEKTVTATLTELEATIMDGGFGAF